MVTGEESKTGLPKSNVLYYALENDAWCCARPSGTEPKIKFYLGVKEKSMEEEYRRIRLEMSSQEKLLFFRFSNPVKKNSSIAQIGVSTELVKNVN